MGSCNLAALQLINFKKWSQSDFNQEHMAVLEQQSFGFFYLGLQKVDG